MTKSRQVLIVQGSVYLMDARGVRRLLRAGEQIGEHERLELAPGARVSLQEGNGRIVTLDGAPPAEAASDSASAWSLDVPDAAVEVPRSRGKRSLALAFDDIGEVLLRARPEVGLPVGDANRGGHGFVRVARIDERVALSHGASAHGEDAVQSTPHQTLEPLHESAHASAESHGVVEFARLNHAATIRGQLRLHEHQEKVSQQLGISDPDPGEDQFQTMVLPLGDANRYASATITSKGMMTLSSKDSPLFCRLQEGEQHTIYFRVFSSDGSSQDIPVTLIGVNDKPTITALPVELTAEALQAFVSALKQEAGAQQGSRVKRSIQVDVTKGETMMSHPNEPSTSQCPPECLQLHAPTQTNPNFRGRMMPNAVGAIANDYSTRLSIGEQDAKGYLSSELKILDKDHDQSGFSGGRVLSDPALVAKYGTFVFDTKSRTLVFFLNQDSEDVKMLKSGEPPVTLAYEVMSLDGTTYTVNVDINGVSTTISGVKGGEIREEADNAPLAAALSGKLDIIGGSQTESLFSTAVIVLGGTNIPAGEDAAAYVAQFGQFSINSSGQWTFVPGGTSWGSLAQNETRDFSYQVSSADGSIGEVVTVHLVGTNSLPTIEIVPVDLPPGIVRPDFAKPRPRRDVSDDGERARSSDDVEGTTGTLQAADVLHRALVGGADVESMAEVGVQPTLQPYFEPSLLLVA